jgi:O-acetyl-ADP-ribose deacetylase (regulator of RNase III)
MIHFVTGDAAAPQAEGSIVIAHVVNNRGGWGKGFALSLSQHYTLAEAFYRDWFRKGRYDAVPFALGQVQLCQLSRRVAVANMLAQDGYQSRVNSRPLNYDALARCLKTVSNWATDHRATIHMPRIGSGLAGGDWTVIESLLENHLAQNEVYVYTLPRDAARMSLWAA